MMVKISNQGTAYQLYGDEKAPVVVLIHGIGLNREIWQVYIAVLSKQYRVLAYDLCGHGQSRVTSETMTLSFFVKELHDLLEELSIETCSLIGFSLGGMINRLYAMRFPNRVQSLVILNSPHERTLQAQKDVEARFYKTSQEGIKATLDATLARWFTPQFLSRESVYIDGLKQVLLANDSYTYTSCRYILATAVMELLSPQPLIEVLGLIMTGENDSGSTPAMSHAMANDFVRAEVQIVPELKHMGLVERPELFIVPILNFLESESK